MASIKSGVTRTLRSTPSSNPRVLNTVSRHLTRTATNASSIETTTQPQLPAPFFTPGIYFWLTIPRLLLILYRLQPHNLSSSSSRTPTHRLPTSNLHATPNHKIRHPRIRYHKLPPHNTKTRSPPPNPSPTKLRLHPLPLPALRTRRPFHTIHP